ncbi:helix-turn-helix transcriptional regulator [Lentzea sp. NPDC006480]|uniref:helix-turn-helix domain-containing protein n=1 Tax=Lentzea sp. NPDC006480 TaxID=3157176 RepID=UPI0033A0089A
MTQATSTAYSRDLGDELRLLRERFSTLNGRKFAIQLGWDPSKVSNIENGKARASEIDLAQYLTACGQDIEFFDDFKRRYYNAFDLVCAQTLSSLRTLAMTESTATKITSYEPASHPGLLQTKQFAREVLAEGGVHTPEDVERLAEARIERQTVLRRPFRPDCLFYIHELALRQRVANAQAMEDQYLRLMCHTHIIRIVPLDVGTASLETNFTLYEFDKAAPIVFSETNLVQVFAQDDAVVKQCRDMFERLETLALDEERSKSKLVEYINALREAPDGSRA